ncbi:shTK domain protein [Cooperia oncophora]
MKFTLTVLLVLEGINVILTDNPSSTTHQYPPHPSTAVTGTAATPTASSCEDDPGAKCENLKPQCLDHRYDELMDKYCPKTCNRCDKLKCVDTSALCSVWNAQGFCKNTFYSDDIKKQYCARTCDLC